MTLANVLRVFTDENGAYGNPLGVVVEDDPLQAESLAFILRQEGYVV
jgi:predicted PhzF superfamily epimerase YddE/YHI9